MVVIACLVLCVVVLCFGVLVKGGKVLLGFRGRISYVDDTLLA